VIGHLIWRYLLAQNPWPIRADYVIASGTLYTIFLFLPLTVMVLQRPNEEGFRADQPCDRRWPVWMRGREGSSV
jgi:hypothetical protein